KDPARIDVMSRDAREPVDSIPRFLVIVLSSLTAYAVVFYLMIALAPEDAVPLMLRPHFSPSVGSAVSLWSAYALGLVAAAGICLPSFYFFAILAGLRISFLQTTMHVMKGLAS